MESKEFTELQLLVTSLKEDVASIKSDTRSLSDKVAKIDQWMHALAIVAVIFGLAGAWGWNLLSAAKGQLSDLETQTKSQLSKVDAVKNEMSRFVDLKKQDLTAAIEQEIGHAVSRNDTGSRLLVIERQLAGIGSDERVADGSRIFGGQSGVPLNAICPVGYVARGLKLVLGGVCGGKCEPDGRPISSVQVLCTKQVG